jgi:hypothetical protein
MMPSRPTVVARPAGATAGTPASPSITDPFDGPQPGSDAAVDLHGREARARLARMVMRLLDHWALGASEQAALLGLSTGSRSTLARYRAGEPLADSRDLIDRAGHLLGIHKSLRILFPHDRDLAYRWVSQPNARLGGRPVDLINAHGFEGLLAVRRYLDHQRGR